MRAEAAEQASKHLVMAGRLVDTDPLLAHAHASAARRFGPRVAVIREALGIAAYHAGKYAEALSELRAARRISGNDEHLPVMADCERGLGRPERALAMAADPAVATLDRAGRVEMRIVAAGARSDRGELEAAVVTLQTADLQEKAVKPWSARLRCAYAEALFVVGRLEEAREWFARAAEVDPEGETAAEDRLAELDGVVFLTDEDLQDDNDTVPEQTPPAGLIAATQPAPVAAAPSTVALLFAQPTAPAGNGGSDDSGADPGAPVVSGPVDE